MSSPPPPSTPAEKTIVLIIPAAGIDDPARLRATLVTPNRAVRVLVCIPQSVDQSLGISLARMLKDMGVGVQVLFHSKMEMPKIADFQRQAPADMPADRQIDFALALSDFVLVVPGSDPQLLKTAKRLKKEIVEIGGALPGLSLPPSVTDGLDPEQPGWRSLGRSVFGRLEKAISEVFAFAWLGWNEAGRAESTGQLKKCFSSKWHPTPYFAPDAWKDLAPDKTALDTSSKIVACFEAMDRSAVQGSRIHRDLIWIAHFLAAFAVFAAVAGELWKPWTDFWGIIELLALVSVLVMILWARRSRLQDRWTACRLGAEQLRIARMSLPFLVLPPALSTTLATSEGRDESSEETKQASAALEEVKRALRDHGLPRRDESVGYLEAAEWIHCIVADQIKYHHKNHHQLHHAEKRLHWTTGALFFIALAAVIYHLLSHEHWLLLLTAAGPAFAAALHGAGTRLGIVHRAALSQEMGQELKRIDRAITEFKEGEHPDPAEAECEVRRLADDAAKAMGSENKSWHGLVRRYRDELP